MVQGHFQLDLVFLPQAPFQLHAVQGAVAGGDDQLGGVHGVGAFHQTQVLEGLQFFPYLFQTAVPGGKGGGALRLQKADAAVDRGQEQVGGAAALENPRLALHLRQGHQTAAYVEDGRLGEAGQELVEAGYGQVRPLLHGVFGKPLP